MAVYDNFEEPDSIELTVKYVDDNETIITIPLQAVKDYRRIIFNLAKPNNGWLIGT